MSHNKRMFFKKYKFFSAILPIMASLILATIYYCYFGRNLDFWDSIVGIFLSLTAGIPFALWIDRTIKLRDEEEKSKFDRSREKDILMFIEKELNFNSALVLQVRDIKNADFHPLQTEMWEVLKSSGDLKLILDTELLNRITSAYDIIFKVKHFEEKSLDDWNVSNSGMDIGSTWQVQFNRAKNFYGLMDESMGEAIRSITKRIDNINKLR